MTAREWLMAFAVAFVAFGSVCVAGWLAISFVAWDWVMWPGWIARATLLGVVALAIGFAEHVRQEGEG